MDAAVRAWLDELKSAAGQAMEAERVAMLARVTGRPIETMLVTARYDPLILECYSKMCVADVLYGRLPDGCRNLLLKVAEARCANLVAEWRRSHKETP